jgi:putative aminopeptidase FrvX
MNAARAQRTSPGVETMALLRMLCEAFGVAGFEDEARETVRALAEPLADEVRVDGLGNLLVTRRGGPAAR